MRNPTQNAHVQSYIFALDRETLNHLIQREIFTTKYYPVCLYDAVLNREIRMSRVIVEKGWNIGSLLPYYDNVDFTFQTKKPEEYKPFLDDVMFQECKDVLWNKYQLVFIKGNRNI